MKKLKSRSHEVTELLVRYRITYVLKDISLSLQIIQFLQTLVRTHFPVNLKILHITFNNLIKYSSNMEYAASRREHNFYEIG